MGEQRDIALPTVTIGAAVVVAGAGGGVGAHGQILLFVIAEQRRADRFGDHVGGGFAAEVGRMLQGIGGDALDGPHQARGGFRLA